MSGFAKEAIRLAGSEAVRAGAPWGDQISARRRRVWPFPAVWTVVAHVDSPKAVVTVQVRERARTAALRSVLYLTSSAAHTSARQPGLAAESLLKLSAGGLAGLLACRMGLGWPWWSAALAALPSAWLGLVLINIALSVRAGRGSPVDPVDD